MAEFNDSQPRLNMNLRQLRNQAKDLLNAHRSCDPELASRIRAHHPRFNRSSHSEIASGRFRLTDAQLVIARELGVSSWPRLKQQLENQSLAQLGMHQAVKTSMEAVRAVYERSPDSVNQLSELGHPPLYTAALYKNHEAVEFLLDHGADCDIFCCCFSQSRRRSRKTIDRDAGAVE